MASTPTGSRSPASSSLHDGASIESQEGERPPLPPRPPTHGSKTPTRPPLRSTATTALSLTDIQGHSVPETIRGTPGHSKAPTPSRSSVSYGSPRTHLNRSRAGSDGDSSSVRSFLVNALPSADVGALLEEALATDAYSTWTATGSGTPLPQTAMPSFSLEEPLGNFDTEFEDIGELDADNGNGDELLAKWRGKLKHFHILSAAGKPIYNRHGSDTLISGEIGVIQTIISFYEGADDKLKSFTAGKAVFVVMTQGPLYLLAISRLGESDSQLRNQLEALYMQILSTLTLPRLTNMFSLRPSTDLRRPLQGTDSLLSALADSFTRGSPSTLLSALECLKIKNSQRQAINNTLLKAKTKDLLYGLIVAGGRLVSVVRPRTHSLHPGDLQLIFNMVFEAGGVKAGGGDSWIPLCLPGFNKNGFLYMYVSFVEMDEPPSTKEPQSSNAQTQPPHSDRPEDQIAILLISAEKEAFFELQAMKDAVINDLSKHGLLSSIRAATLAGRPSATSVAPGTPLQHFLYKSRGNLQYVTADFAAPLFGTALQRRRLISLYHRLHADAHSGAAGGKHLHVHHVLSEDAMALAWLTPLFELYCVAEPSAPRAALALGANKVVQWIRREEERVFIIGGAVF